MIVDTDHVVEDNFVMVQHDDEGVPNGYLHGISACVDDRSPQLRHISLEIHDNPELQYEEFHAHEVLTKYLKDQRGWKVTPSAYNIPTAFVAEFDSTRPGPVVSFNAEYDALKGIGHACGHNLIAVASLAAALATAEIIRTHSLNGKVVLFGTPAEEGRGGKIKLLKAGAYSDHKVDISLMSHPGIGRNRALISTAAFTAFKAEYFGKEAHAAARPWDGINALDALITAYNAISVLRQQTQPGDIIQAQILNGGARPNIVHAYSSGRFVVRSSTRARRDALLTRVRACFEGAAIATGARLELTIGGSYEDHVPNKVLGRAYRRWFRGLGGEMGENEELELVEGRTSASTDQGNVSYVLPSITPDFWIRSETPDGKQLGGPHTPDFEKAARAEEAHGMAMRVGKALAATAVDVLTIPGLLEEAKKEFDEMKRADAARD